MKRIVTTASLTAILAASGVSMGQTPAAQPPAVRPPLGALADRSPSAMPAELTQSAGGMTAEVAAVRAMRASASYRAARENTHAAEAARRESLLQMIPNVGLTARYTRLSEITAPQINFGGASSLPICADANGGLFVGIPGGGAGATLLCPGMTRPLPTGGGGGQGGGFSFPVILDNVSMVGTVTVPITDLFLRLSRAYEAAGLTEQARRLDEESARAQSALDGRLSFYEVLRAQGQLAVATLAVENARRRRDDVQHFVDAGTVARVELLRTEALMADAERVEALTRGMSEVAEGRLRLVLGMSPDEAVSLGESLDSVVTVPTNLTDLLRRAWGERPEIASLERQRQALDATRSAVRAGMFPSLAGVFNVTVASPHPRFVPQSTDFNATWDASLQLSWSPTATLVASATSDRLGAQRAAVTATIAQLQAGLELEVRQAFTSARASQSAVEAARRQSTAAEESFRVRRERFLAGSATQAELVDADRELLGARWAVINANVDVRVALARLRRAVGQRED